MATGGSIRKVSLAGRIFAVAADADISRVLGGDSNEIQPNGDKSARIIKTVNTWKLDGLVLTIEENRNDQQFLQELANGTAFFDVTMTTASRDTYNGQGMIAGDPPTYSTQSATATINVHGQGDLTKQ